MKKIFLSLTIIFCLSCGSKIGFAKEKILFWYPGEAGSSAEAQPILDEFTMYLTKKIPKLKLQAIYLNSKDSGSNFIKKNKPVLAIISYATWTEYKPQLGSAKIWLATKPFPKGKTKEKYVLVGKKNSQLKPALVLSSEPLTKDFILNHLQLESVKNIKPKQTRQILFDLKKIAQNQLNAYAILTPTEAYTFRKLDLAWSKEIKILEDSQSVPTARVVLLKPFSKQLKELKQILLQMEEDSAAQDILNELRLKGFALINDQPEKQQTDHRQ